MGDRLRDAGESNVEKSPGMDKKQKGETHTPFTLVSAGQLMTGTTLREGMCAIRCQQVVVWFPALVSAVLIGGSGKGDVSNISKCVL